MQPVHRTHIKMLNTTRVTVPLLVVVNHSHTSATKYASVASAAGGGAVVALAATKNSPVRSAYTAKYYLPVDDLL